jgi:hypothetical protein
MKARRAVLLAALALLGGLVFAATAVAANADQRRAR